MRASAVRFALRVAALFTAAHRTRTRAREKTGRKEDGLRWFVLPQTPFAFRAAVAAADAGRLDSAVSVCRTFGGGLLRRADHYLPAHRRETT